MLPKALLSKVRMLHRSLTSPVSGFACSQKYQKLAASSSCSSASSLSEKSLGPTKELGELGGRSCSCGSAAKSRGFDVANGRHAVAPAIRFNNSRREKLTRLRRSPPIKRLYAFLERIEPIVSQKV